MHARDGANILEETYTEAVHRLNLYLMNKVAVTYKGRPYAYNDLCLGWRDQGCFRNEQVIPPPHLFPTVIPALSLR